MEGPDLVVDLGKTEARLSKKEQSRLENFSIGERVRCVIKAVDKTGKNAGVIVSRAAPELVMRLFEQEVPEIYDGTVQIRGCAREPGERTKIAVLSRDRDVDCVGACVGMKGMRVQSIIRELRGEKIDIIEFSEDPVVFATHALSPAKISRVAIVDSMEKHMEVIVEDTQLSLAIGKKGQNVRLAAKLLGWRIDIKTEEEKRQEVEAQMAAMAAGTPLSVLSDYGLPEPALEALLSAGVTTVERMGGMTPEELEAIPAIDPEAVQALVLAVNQYYQAMDAPAEAGTAPVLDTPELMEPEVESAPAEETAEVPVETVADPVEAADPEPAGTEPEQPSEPELLSQESDTMENSGFSVTDDKPGT
jgi:transcription termination/antitermination protein NusA